MRRRTFLGATTASALSAVSGCASSILETRSASIGWSYSTDEIVEFEIGEEHVYVLGKSKLHAISLTDGTQVWTYPIENPSGFELYDSTVYVYGEKRLAAIDRSTGRERWYASGSYQSVFRGKRAVVGYKWNGVDTLAFDPETGDQKWKWSGSRLGRLSESVALTYEDRLMGIDLANGNHLWTFEEGPASYEYTDDRVYTTVETEDNSFTLFALDPATGSIHWQQSSITGHLGRATVFDGVLYVAWRTEESRTGFIAALDPSSGSTQWKRKIGKEQAVPHPFEVEDDTLLVSQKVYDGVLPNLCALDTQTGSQEWKRTDADVVTVSDDRIVLEEKRGRFRGITLAGSTQWTTEMKVVPMAATGGNDPVYTPPRVVSLSGTFAAGFRGTNAISEWRTATGDRTWRLHLDEVFRELKGADKSLFASTGSELVQIRISNGNSGGFGTR